MKLFVEGGGDSHALRTSCREGFSSFITGSGVTKRPRVVACGSRSDAYSSYCTAVKNGEQAMLLVDSETVISAIHQTGNEHDWKPWSHLSLRKGDAWVKPPHSNDTDCHLMVECMENWLLADRTALKIFFGQGFKEEALPNIERSVEQVGKAEVYAALKQATKKSQKGEYGKGEHSFKLLKEIDPLRVIGVCPWAKRFINELKKVMEQ